MSCLSFNADLQALCPVTFWVNGVLQAYHEAGYFFLPRLKEKDILPDDEQLRRHVRSNNLFASKKYTAPPILS